MFSDTHFHFHMIDEERQSEVLKTMAERNCFFGLDIGTGCKDLDSRQMGMIKAIEAIPEKEIQEKIKSFIYFSCGIWPEINSIKNRNDEIKILEGSLQKALESENPFFRKICAVGECGLDHHWNPSGADGRSENDFDQAIYEGEVELFEMQIDLAKKYSLPVIIHSRDAYSETYDCLKRKNYDNGIVHCYSYGLDEAKTFLDRGWYLAFGGGVTYTKKSKMDAMMELLRYVPKERILLETDAPYLAPVPFRGNPNTPVLIEHTYKFISEIRGCSVEELCDTVDENVRKLFNLK